MGATTRYTELVLIEQPTSELTEADVITLTEAAKLLNMKLPNVNQMVNAGKLRVFIDTNEPNPQRYRRVLRAEALKLKAQREG